MITTDTTVHDLEDPAFVHCKLLIPNVTFQLPLMYKIIPPREYPPPYTPPNLLWRSPSDSLQTFGRLPLCSLGE